VCCLKNTKKLGNLFEKKEPPANNDRMFELRITDRMTKNVYAITVKIKIGVSMDSQEKLRSALVDGFDALVSAVFRGGSLPEVSAVVVRESEVFGESGAPIKPQK